MKQKLKLALSQRQKIRNPDTTLIPSAVLVPLFYQKGEYYLLFTKRTENVRVHKGHISFPGGVWEEKDGSLLNTALRECAEEIGLAADAVDVLGELDDFHTISSDYIITPFVAFIPWPYPFKLDPWEVAEIITAPVSSLLHKDCLTQEVENWRGKEATTYFYHYQDKVIWGASARILHQFLEIWSAAAEG
jgi:8-oxo-dGTP pyrophosphatase MutT (NUDIX family)